MGKYSGHQKNLSYCGRSGARVVALEVCLGFMRLLIYLASQPSPPRRPDRRVLRYKRKVVTSFKLRAYPYTQSIYAGQILLPKNKIPEIARAVADFTQRSHDAKLGMFLYVLKAELLEAILKESKVEEDMLVVHAFDAHGEEHGRSDDGFGWALRLEGAIDETRSMNLKGVADLQSPTFPWSSRIT